MNRCAGVAALVLAGAAAVHAQSAQNASFAGSTRFSEASLRHALAGYSISLDPPIEPTTADDAAYFLREFLFDRGLPHAEVTYAFSGGTVVFTVDDGERFRLGTLSFPESRTLTAERMSAIFTGEIRRQTRTPFGPLPYVASAVEAGSERIRHTLVHDGFLDAAVSVSESFGERSVDLAFTVEPGPQYHIAGVDLTGAEITPAIQEAARASAGAVFHPGDNALLRAQVLDTLRREGFFRAAVTEELSTDPQSATVRIALHVESGDRYQIGTIRIDGNQRTHTRAILRRLGLKPGTRYNAESVDEAIRRIWFTGAFSDVQEKQTPTPANDVDIHLNLTEAPAKQLSTTVGYGQWDRAFGEMTYLDRNFLGTLNRFGLRGFLSTRSYGIESNLSDPWFLQTDAIATLSGFYIRQELPAFKATQYGTTVSVERKFSQQTLTSWRVAYQWKVVTNSTVFADSALDGAATNYTLGELSFQQILDRRNDILSPMKGFYLSWEPGVASRVLGGEISFFRLNVQATAYLPLRKITPEVPFVPFIVLNHRAGLMQPYADTREIPVQERFFLGGPDTVRSFQLDGMGPRDAAGTPEGGLAYLLGNAEIQWPIWKALYVAAFVDVGNLSPTLEDFSWDNTRIGVGLGGRVYTPIGAIRVDYGHNLIRKDGDPLGAWQFGFGFTF